MKYAVRTIYNLPTGKDIYENWPMREKITKLEQQAQILSRENERTWTDTVVRTITTIYSSKDVYDSWIEFLSTNGHQTEIDNHNSSNGITVSESSWEF
jgi:hypothetical protein